MQKFDVSKSKKPTSGGKAAADPTRAGWLTVHDRTGKLKMFAWYRSIARVVAKADAPGSCAVCFHSTSGGGYEILPISVVQMHAAITAAMKAAEVYDEQERAKAAKAAVARG